MSEIASPPPLPVPGEVIEFFARHSAVTILGHLEPDGDCIGSQVALAGALRRRGTTVHLGSPGPFERPEIAAYQHEFVTDPEQIPDTVTGVIVLDCSGADRIEPFERLLTDRETLVVDHHKEGEAFGDVRWIRPDIPATTILVDALIETLVDGPDEREASALFLGLVTDTGFFRFLGAGQSIAFATAAHLTDRGASPRETADHLDSGRSLGSRRMIGRMLDRVEELEDGRVLLTYLTRQDELEFGNRRDTDTLYRLLLAVEDVRVIGVVKEKEHGCTVSFRANDDTDVSQLARTLGGGGHQKAAGAFSPAPLLDFIPRVRSILSGL